MKTWSTVPQATKVAALVAAGAIALLAVLAIGLIIRTRTPRPPDVRVTVHVAAPGYGALDLDQLVARPIEQSLRSTPALESTEAWSTEGAAFATFRFHSNTDPIEAASRVRERVSTVPLPEDVQPPVVSIRTTGDPILRYDLTHAALPPRELQTMHDRGLSSALMTVSGVERVVTCGARSREVVVALDPLRLEMTGIRFSQVHATLVRAPLDGPIHSPEALRTLVVRQSGGVPVRLSDLASIREAESSQGCACLVGGEPALCVSVYGQQSAASDVAERVERWKSEVPPGVQLRVRTAATGVRLDLFGPPELGPDEAIASHVSRVLEPLGDSIVRIHVDTAPPLGTAQPLGTIWLSTSDREPVLRARQLLASSPTTGPLVAVSELSESGVLAVLGEDGDLLAPIARKLRERLAGLNDVTDAIVLGDGSRSVMRVVLKREHMTALGIPLSDMLLVSRLAHGGVEAGTIRDGAESLPIRLTTDTGDSDARGLMTMRVPLPSGSVPLSEIAELRQDRAPDWIGRRNGRRAVCVRVWGEPDSGWEESVTKLFRESSLPPGVSVEWDQQ